MHIEKQEGDRDPDDAEIFPRSLQVTRFLYACPWGCRVGKQAMTAITDVSPVGEDGGGWGLPQQLCLQPPHLPSVSAGPRVPCSVRM